MKIIYAILCSLFLITGCSSSMDVEAKQMELGGPTSPDGKYLVTAGWADGKKGNDVELCVIKIGSHLDVIQTEIKLDNLKDCVSFPANDEIVLFEGKKEHRWRFQKNEGGYSVWTKIKEK